MRKKVLFLCTGNSARSQMAEGLLRHLGGDRFEAVSAGTHPVGLNPLAVQAMQEIGIDISHHRSKHLHEFMHQGFDYVITVCDRAQESCPTYPTTTATRHWTFDDPAGAVGSRQDCAGVFRRVRDDIADHVRRFLRHEIW